MNNTDFKTCTCMTKTPDIAYHDDNCEYKLWYEDTFFINCGGCPYRGIDGGPSPAMCCNHHGAGDMGYIISWNDARTKRLAKVTDCPLMRGRE